MSEMSEDWIGWSANNKSIRHEKQKKAYEVLKDWCDKNQVELDIIEDWHLRLFKQGKTLDIFPQRQKYHNVSDNIRGNYHNLIPFVTKHFNS